MMSAKPQGRLVGECQRCGQHLVEAYRYDWTGIVHLMVGLCSDATIAGGERWDLCTPCFTVVQDAIEAACADVVDISEIPVAELSEIEALRARHTKD